MRTFAQYRREEAKMIAAARRAWLDELAAEFPTRTAAAAAAKIDRSFMVMVGHKCGHVWPTAPSKGGRPKKPKPQLTDDQRADIAEMVKSGISHAEATASVTAPRERVSLYVRRPGAGGAHASA